MQETTAHAWKPENEKVVEQGARSQTKLSTDDGIVRTALSTYSAWDENQTGEEAVADLLLVNQWEIDVMS